jgi:hypothetical protein
MTQIPEKTQEDDEVSEGRAGLDRVPRAAERVDRRQYGGAVVFEDEHPVVGSEGEIGYADDRRVVLVLENDDVIYSFGLPDVNECVANLAGVTARGRCPEWVAMVQIECAVEMYDKEGLVGREDRTCPVKRLDVESASLRAGGKGSDLKWVSVKKDEDWKREARGKKRTSCMKKRCAVQREDVVAPVGRARGTGAICHRASATEG